MKKCILVTVARGKEYFDEAREVLNSDPRFKDKFYRIYIQSPFNASYEDCFNTQPPRNARYSYFDNIIYSLRKAEQLDLPVFYCHADKLKFLTDKFFEEWEPVDDKFQVLGKWSDVNPDWQDERIFELEYYSGVKKFFEKEYVKGVEAMREEAIFYPGSSSSMKYAIETMKPILEFCSLTEDSPYRWMGNGEGIGLGYMIKKSNYDYERFKEDYFSKDAWS